MIHVAVAPSSPGGRTHRPEDRMGRTALGRRGGTEAGHQRQQLRAIALELARWRAAAPCSTSGTVLMRPPGHRIGSHSATSRTTGRKRPGHGGASARSATSGRRRSCGKSPGAGVMRPQLPGAVGPQPMTRASTLARVGGSSRLTTASPLIRCPSPSVNDLVRFSSSSSRCGMSIVLIACSAASHGFGRSPVRAAQLTTELAQRAQHPRAIEPLALTVLAKAHRPPPLRES